MLTIDQIVKVSEEGVNILFKDTPSHFGYKGLYEPGTQAIIIYNKAISSAYDFHITLLHEFVHARDDVLYSHIFFTNARGRVSDISDALEYEEATEQEAINTYKENRGVLDLIKELYKIE